MNAGKPSNDGVILYCYVSGNSPVVRENNVITNGAIVGDMRVGKKVAMRPDAGLSSWKGAPVHRTKRLGKASCRCLVNGEVVSEAILLFGLVDR